MSKRSVKSYAINDKFGDVNAASVAQNFFGAGYVAEARADADEGEKALSVNMRLLTKASATTKHKALAEMAKAIPTTSDEILAGFLYNYIDAVGKHTFHENPQLRCAIYRTLTAFLAAAGKETKRQVVQSLGSFMSYVLFGMHDPDPQVSAAANEAMLACFAEPEKRAVALARSFSEVSAYVTSNLDTAFSGLTAIKNDDEEECAFAMVMGFGTVGYLLAHHPTPSEVQPFALALLKGGAAAQQGYLRRCLPTDPQKPAKIVANAPKVRTAAFSLLTALVAVTAPIPPRDFSFVWQCCMQGITDAQPAVVFAAWQMALKWLERFKSEAVGSMPDGFVGLALHQIDNLGVHTSGAGFEALLSALLPLSAVLSREERHAGVVDDVCGTLVEKVKSFCARPNSREFQLVWATLWECWDLHLLRKSVRGEAAHSAELLAVTLAVLVEQASTATAANSARLWDALEGTVAPMAAKYTLKAVQRPEAVANAEEVLLTLVDGASQFKVISHAADTIVLLRFAARVGCEWVAKGDAVVTRPEVRPVVSAWLGTLLDKLLDVCESSTVADGEDRKAASESKQHAYNAVSSLVRAIAVAPPPDVSAVADASSFTPLFALSDAHRDRIVSATGAWTEFPTRLAPYLFKAERMQSAYGGALTSASSVSSVPHPSTDGVPAPAASSSSPLPSGDATSKTARALLDRIAAATCLDSVSDGDVKVLAVALDSDTIAFSEVISLFVRVASNRRFVDCAAAALRSMARKAADSPPNAAAEEGLPALTPLALADADVDAICDAVRGAITSVWEDVDKASSSAADGGMLMGIGGSHAGVSSLAYNNEAPSDSDDSSSSSTSSSSSSSSSDDSDSDSDSSDSSSSCSSSSSSSSSSDSSASSRGGKKGKKKKSDVEDVKANLAEDIREGLVEWMGIVSDDSFAKFVLPTASADAARRATLVLPIARALFMGVTSVAPLLHMEQYVSLRFLRSALTRVEAAAESQTFLFAVFQKRHFLKADAFDALLALFSATCEEDLLMEEADVKGIIVDFFDRFIYSSTNWAEQHSGTSHLEDLMHAASSPTDLVAGAKLLGLAKAFLNPSPRRGDPTLDVMSLHQMPSTVEALAGMVRLGQIAAALAKDAAGRKALLLQEGDTSAPLDTSRVAAVVVALVAVLHLRLALSDGVVKAAREALHDILMTLPTQGSFASADDEARSHGVWRSAMQGLAANSLLPCLAEVVADLFDKQQRGSAVAYSRRSVTTAAAEWYVTSSRDQQQLYAEAFQSFLERSGVANSDRDRSIALSSALEGTVRVALKAPTTPFPIAVALLMVFRGSQSAPDVTDDEVTALGMRCQKPGDEVNALALVSELMCAKNSNQSLYTELCRMTTQAATRVYTLAQLPSNGKLLQRPPTVVPPSLESIQPVIAALSKASKGMAMHRKRDDVLRSTINLVVFDAVCDAVSRLRAATTSALAPVAATASASAFSAANLINSRNTSLASLVIFVAKAYRHIATLQSGDIASIGASESAVAVISATLASVHMWVCGSTVAQLEAIGLSNILEVVSCVNTLAIVALNQSPAPIAQTVHLTRRRLLVKGARVLHTEATEEAGRMTTATVVKMPYFKKLFTDIERTTKQKLSLLTWLTSWACTLGNKRLTIGTAEEGGSNGGGSPTSPSGVNNSSSVDRAELVQVLDIALALLLCPYEAHGGKGRVDNTFLYIGAEQLAPEDTGFGFRPQVLGKLQKAAAVHTAKRMGQELMGVLARGAACVLALAVQSAALPAVRDWLESIDPSVRSRFLSFAEDHLCPILIQTSLVGVLSHSPTGEFTFEVEEGYTVRIDMDRRYIGLSYTFEDVVSSLDITLPPTYPIAASADMVKPTVVGSGKQAVQLRTWCMRMSMQLFSGEAQSLWDAVEMFGRNMKSYLEGVEPCPICYCVMSAKRTIPDMSCSVCKNKCHKSCLNKWWASTGNCTCPYCRSPWVV